MRTFFLAVVLTVPLVGWAGDSVYVMTLAGKKCSESPGQQLDCTFRVGKDLEFVIAGIGQPDTAIAFMHSSFDGDFYGTVGTLHGCVIVKAGRKTVEGDQTKLFQFAFVSPRNGKVYATWQDCQTAH